MGHALAGRACPCCPTHGNPALANVSSFPTGEALKVAAPAPPKETPAPPPPPKRKEPAQGSMF